MLIQCTKKLLDKIGVESEEISQENPLFCWHANLIKIDRSNVVVLVNNSNRYTLVLWGLYAANLKKLEEKIRDVIRETFRAECISDDVIDEYLAAAGDVKFTKTSGRSAVAHLNHSCDNLWFYSNRMGSDFSDGRLGKKCSSRKVKFDGEYVYPYKKLAEELEEMSKKPVVRCKAVKLKINLDLDNNEVSRTVIVPLEKTLGEFHRILQVLFSWQDYHLHEFVIYDDKKEGDSNEYRHDYTHKDGWKARLLVVMDEESLEWKDGIPAVVELGQKLYEFLPGRIKYVYDFGDYWEHYIETVETIGAYDKSHATLVGWIGDSLPEDVGGSGGYSNFLDVLANEKHEEHEMLMQWGEMMGYGPYDSKLIEWRLNYI